MQHTPLLEQRWCQHRALLASQGLFLSDTHCADHASQFDTTNTRAYVAYGTVRGREDCVEIDPEHVRQLAPKRNTMSSALTPTLHRAHRRSPFSTATSSAATGAPPTKNTRRIVHPRGNRGVS